MARKMPRQLVALSSSAIAAIYFAGLVATRAADAGIASAAAADASPTALVSTATAVAGQPAAVVSARATSTATTTQSAGYQDVTYSGTGTSRRGNVSVSVTVQSGRIATVTIS